MRNTLPAAPRLFENYDLGMHDLPKNLTALRRAVATIEEATFPEPTTADGAIHHLAADMCDAAMAGADLPTITTGVQRARQAEQDRRDLHTARTSALETLTTRMNQALREQADHIIVEHLRPAHDEVAARLNAVLPVVARYEGNHRAALRAVKADRDLYAELDPLVTRYEALVASRWAVVLSGQATVHDTADEFGMVRNLDQLWPKQGRHLQGRPWGKSATTEQHLRWLIENGAELWMPTAAEQDARWLEVYGEAFEQQRRNSWAAQASRASFA